MSAIDLEVFDKLIDQLKRYIREWLLPAKADVNANHGILYDILSEKREIAFGITLRGFSGAGTIIAQPASRRTAGPALPRTMTLNEQFREMRLYLVAPISLNMILSFVADHILGLPRSY